MPENIYNSNKPRRFLDNLALKKRYIMFQIFKSEFPEYSFDTVLDVGATDDREYNSTNYFEKLFPHKNKIIALSNQNAAFLEEVYPGLTFTYGDAKKLPFNDESIDIVFSSAVIEHLGSWDNQKKMISECVRVAKKGIFITTPNRWYPLEVHTLIPLIHWLPKKLHRKILNHMGYHFYSAEENLNLLDRRSLTRMCQSEGVKHFYFKQIATLGLISNLMLIIRK